MRLTSADVVSDSPSGSTGLVLSIVGLLLFVGGILAIYDEPLSQFIVQRKWPSDVKRLIGLSEVMAHGLAVAIILLLVYLVAIEVRPYFWWLVACPLAAGLGANVIKSTVSRYRPYRYWSLQAEQEEIAGTFVEWLPILNSEYLRESFRQAFPSGHTATAFGLAVALSWAFPRGRYVFFSLAVLAGLQRIVSNSHWPSDVCVGAAVGLLLASMVQWSVQWQAVRVRESGENGPC